MVEAVIILPATTNFKDVGECKCMQVKKLQTGSVCT